MSAIANHQLTEPKLRYIDSLRGIAIIMVILTHADKYVPELQWPVKLLADYGQMGVQLFFIVSAFTLCLTFDKRNSEESGLSKFYLRRYFRIAPLYYFGILLYLLYFSIIEPVLSGAPPLIHENYTLRNIVSNLFLINDFVPGPANNKVVPGGWSIGTETTFYALFPFIFLFYKKYQKNKWSLLLIPVVAIAGCFIAVQLIGAVMGLSLKNNSLLYFNIVCQLPVFLMGISLYFLLSRNGRVSYVKPLLYAIGFLLTFVAALFVFRYSSEMAFFIPIVAGISFLFLFMLFKAVSINVNWLSRIGQLSYSIYLLHFIFAWEGSKLLTKTFGGVVNAEIIYACSFFATLLLSVVFAIASEKLIEKPGINLGKKFILYISAKQDKVHQHKTKRRFIFNKKLNQHFEIN